MNHKSSQTEILRDPLAAIQAIEAILDNAAEGIMTADERGIIESFNRAASRIFGYTADEIMGRNIRTIIPRPYLREHESYRPKSSKEDNANSVISLGREVTGKHKDGHSFPLDLSVSQFESGSRTVYTAIVRDITERKQAQADLSESRQLLRQLTAHLQTVREEERTRIAREVHDELGQSLTGVKMDIAWLMSRLSDRPELLKRVNDMSTLVDESIQNVRKIASDLRPGILDNLGLVPALEWQASDFQTRTGVECNCQIRFQEGELDPNLKTNLFRIFQETLTNVMRHAQATRVDVSLVEKDEQITLKVKDDGKGITEEESAGSKSLGLLGMQERVLLLGGTFAISGAPGKGTSVSVTVPRQAQ